MGKPVYAWKLMGRIDKRVRPFGKESVMSIGGGTMRWRIGQWYTVQGRLALCRNGFHCAPDVASAARVMGWQEDVNVLALVQVKGQHVSSTTHDKSAWRSMRIVKAVRWGPGDWRALAGALKPMLLSTDPKHRGEDWAYVALNRYRWTCSHLESYEPLSRGEVKRRADNAKTLEKWLRTYVKTQKTEVR